MAFVVEMTGPFECQTMEGFVVGKVGDYLAVGVNNEVWPIDKHVFEQSYEIVEDDEAVSKKVENILLTTIK